MLLLAAQLEKVGIGVDLVDLNTSEFDPRMLEGKMAFGTTATTPLYPAARRLLGAVTEFEQHSGRRIQKIVGGPHVTAVGEDVLGDGWTTACAGEGELIVADIVGQQRTGLVVGGLVEKLDELPYPARHLLTPQHYSREEDGQTRPRASVITTRGCPFSCIYCAQEVKGGRRVRNRSIENVIGEVDEVIEKYGVRDLVFYDDTFTLDKKRTIALCDELSSRRISFRCAERVDAVDSEVLRAMARAGCQNISYGLESADPRVLKEIHKGSKVSAERAAEVVRQTQDAGIEARVFFMFGFPWDSWDSVKANLEFLEQAQPKAARLSFLVPMPGSELYHRAKEFGIDLPSEWEDYHYLANGGPTTFIKRTLLLDEKEFVQASTQLVEGFARWAEGGESGHRHITNVRTSS
jgi:radical SAM superfamily enzyme YgiQ (UPF0313 family)